MKVELFCICEAAKLTDGVLSIGGVFNRRWATAEDFPFSLQVTIAAHLRFEADEEGEHKLAVVLTDLDANRGGTPPVTLTVRTEPTLTATWISWAGTFEMSRLDGPNEWTVELLLDEVVVASTDLIVAIKSTAAATDASE